MIKLRNTKGIKAKFLETHGEIYEFEVVSTNQNIKIRHRLAYTKDGITNEKEVALSAGEVCLIESVREAGRERIKIVRTGENI